jgi:hypothetical protein
MPSFKDITVVAIHGNGGIRKSIPALERTAAALPGCRKLFITDVRTEYPGVEQKLVHRKLNYRAYSHFVIYCLEKYIDTDYALIVQDDGWALNAANWRDQWFEYDYIGGATHAALAGDRIYKYFTWIGNTTNPLVVQNGGFSLRSRKFLAAPTSFGITVVHQQHDEFNNEDIQICCFMRPALEKVGMRFAPLEEAMLFSFEHLSPQLHKDFDPTRIFGNHSRFRRLISDNEVLITLSDEEIRILPWEDRVIDLLRHYGYQIRRAQPAS